MAKQPDAPLNHEAIPAQQPNAASPGPDLGQRRSTRGSAGLIFTIVLIALLLASLLLALRDV